MNGFLIDTNVLIEGIKGNAKELLFLIDDNLDEYEFCIPVNVLEELVFILLRGFSGVGYWKLKKDSDGLKAVYATKVKPFVEYFTRFFRVLDVNFEVFKISCEIVERYGLLLNDALILATCKHYGIKYLISLDKDFERACAEEKVVLVSDAEKLRAILER